MKLSESGVTMIMKLARFLTTAIMVIMLGWGARPSKCQIVTIIESTQTLPSLEVVIEQSKRFSPVIAEHKALVKKSEKLVDLASKNWLDGISIGVQTTAGSYGNAVLDQLNTGVTAVAGVRFSLFDIFAQRNQKQIWGWELEVSREMFRTAEVDEIQDIVRLYHQLIEAQQQIEVRGDSWGSAQIHREMAELEFQNGDINIAELARVSQIEAKSQSDYISTIFEYNSWYVQLEVRIGARLTELH